MKYRKQPVVIDAWQFTGQGMMAAELNPPSWLRERIGEDVLIMPGLQKRGSRLDIKTLEGRMAAHPGDWIIKGVNGEIYPCKPDIFAKTYAPAIESEEEARQRGWAEENLPIPDTIEQAVAERNNWVDTAHMHYRNEQDYRRLLVEIGEMFGEAAKTSDDGSVQDHVLTIKVPALVKCELGLIDALRSDIERLNAEIERITRRQQGILAEQERRVRE